MFSTARKDVNRLWWWASFTSNCVVQHLLLYALKCSESSAKKDNVLKLLQPNKLHFHPLPLCWVFSGRTKNKTAWKLKKNGKKKNLAKWPPSPISMPLLGNLYKELILEPVKTWQPKAGGALHKVARGAAAIPRDQTGTWQQFLVLDCPHLGMPSCRNFWVGGYLLCNAKINFTRYLPSRVFSVVCLSCSDTYHIV